MVPCLAVPDGAWNGNPWQKEALKKGVIERKPEALAEMAYCMRSGWNGAPYDPARIFEYARESAATGNPYGQAILSRCFVAGDGVGSDPAKAMDLAKRSARAGHPLGMKDLANFVLDRSKKTDADYQTWQEQTRKSAEAGCLLAETNLMKSRWFAMNGFKLNRQECMEMAVEALHRTAAPDYQPAQFVANLTEEELKRYGVDDKTVALAVARLEMAARSGVPEPMALLGSRHCRTGQADRGFPMIVRAAESGDKFAIGKLFEFAATPNNQMLTGVGCDHTTIYRLARKAYAGGMRSHILYVHLLNSYLFRDPVLKEKPDPEKALPIAREMQRNGYTCSCFHSVLARIYFSEISGKLTDRKRGMAHYTFISKSRPEAIARIAHCLWGSNGENHDPVRAFAAAVCGTKLNSGQSVGDLRDVIARELTPEQRAEADDLIKRDYPVAEEFRRESLKTLIEYGDAPVNATLDPTSDE